MIDCNENTHFIKVSESVFIFSDQTPQPIEEPNLELSINEHPVAVTYDRTLKESTYYKFNATLKPGDKIEIAAHTDVYGHLKGADVIPNTPQILDVTPEWFTGAADEISYLRTKIKIKDRQNESNYYRIVIHNRTIFPENDPEDITWQNQEVYVDQEILYKEITGSLGDSNTSMFAIFSDELFRDQEYTLNVYIRMDNFRYADAKQYVKVEIHSLSENLYHYLRSVELAANEDNFTEPIKIFSNINGGFGVLGTYTTDWKMIEVK